ASVAAGGEIGRAQAAQAEAAGVEPSVDMNPILLKPESDHRSQVVVRGRPVASADWRAYREMQGALLGIVAESLERLRRTVELVLIEGAGSPAEINLRDHDIVNMRVARLAEARVLLVGDVDRGGVFAALVGTLALLDPADRVRGGAPRAGPRGAAGQQEHDGGSRLAPRDWPRRGRRRRGRGGPPRPRRLRRLPDARRGPPRSGARRVRAGSRGRARPPAGDD